MTSLDESHVFVLGDSRTGTTSVHRYLLDCGYKSIHFFMDEVGEIAKKHGHSEVQYSDVKEFIDESGYNAFSDYPTRSYFEELYTDYPDAHFVLTTRENVGRWIKSMQSYFKETPWKIQNLDFLSNTYLRLNDEIRDLYTPSRKFLELSIDDGSDVNSSKLNEFLSIGAPVSLRQLNASGQGARFKDQ